MELEPTCFILVMVIIIPFTVEPVDMFLKITLKTN